MNQNQLWINQIQSYFYIIAIVTLVGLHLLLYLWFWFWFIRRNEKIILAKTNLPQSFINLSYKRVYARHNNHVFLWTIALFILTIVIALFYALAVRASDNADVLNIYFQHFGLFLPMGIGVTIVSIIVSLVTSKILLMRKKAPNEDVTIDLNLITEFADINPDEYEPFSNNLYFGARVFIFLWWLPAFYASTKIKDSISLAKIISNKGYDNQTRDQKLIQEMSYMTNYLWYNFVFFTKNFKLEVIKQTLATMLVEVNKDKVLTLEGKPKEQIVDTTNK
ncbi:hypothetical protein ACA758_04780 [Mycoplasmopsis agassizii]|uniref:hypothetical protein n=1 Tax=Mycoplasmopsis agassizii TaxID=33922 RepID=UPI0035282485